MEYVEYAGGVRTPSARSDGEETDPSSPDIGPSGDAGILGTLKAILVGGVTDLLTDYPRPTPRSVSRARETKTAEKHSQRARAQNVNHLRASDTFQRSGNNFTSFATDARLRASATDGFSSGIWATPNRQSPPISPVRRSGRFIGSGRGGGDVAPANSLVGSPTAGGGPAGLLGAVFSGFSSLGQRATDLLTQLDHDFETIFHGGDEEAARAEEGEPPAAAAHGAPSADAGQRAPPQTGLSPDDPRSTSSGTSGPSSTGICPGSSAPQEAVAVTAPGLPSPAGGALLKGLHVRAPTPAISSGASDKPQSATSTCSVGARVGTPKSDGGAAGGGTGRGGSAHTPVSSGGAGRGTIAKTTRVSGHAMATRASDGGAAAWAKQSDDDWGWGTSHDLADDGVGGGAAASRANTTNITSALATDKSSQVQQPFGPNVKPQVQAPSSTAITPLHSTRSGPVCSVSSATSGPSTYGSAAATQASGGSARSTSRRSAGGKLIIIKSSAARIEGGGAGGAAAAAQPSPCTPTQAICATPADRVNDAGTTSPTPTTAEAAFVSSVIAKSEDMLATAATWPVALSTDEVMPLPALRCQSSPPQRQQEHPQQAKQPLPHQQQVQQPELLEQKPQQEEQQGQPPEQNQDQLPEQLEQPQQQQQQQLQFRDDNDVQSESERRLSELQQRFEAALADAARLAEALEATRTELKASRRRCEELEQEKAQLCKLLPPEVATGWAASASAPLPNTQCPKSRAPAAATEPVPTTGYSHSTSSPCHAHLQSSYAHSHATVMLAKHSQLASRSHSRTHSRRGSAGSGIRGFGGSGVGNDELMEATLVAQLTAALADKARLWQENDILTRKLAGLQELLSYTLHHASCGHSNEGYDQRDCTVGRDDEMVTGHAFDIHHLRGEMGFDSAYCLDHTPCYYRAYTSPPAPPPEHYSGLGAATPAEAQGGEDVLVPGATTSCTPIGQPFGCASGSGSCDGGVVTYHNLCFESDETRPGGFAWTPEVDAYGGGGRGAAPSTLLPPTTDASVARSGADWLISPALLSPSLSGYSAIATPATALDFNYAMDELTPGGYIGSRNSDGDDVSPATIISQIAATLAAHANEEFTRAGEDLHSQPHVLATSSPSCARTTSECVKWEPLDEAGEVVVARRWVSSTEERAPHRGREAGNKAPPCAVAGGTVLGPYGAAAGECGGSGESGTAATSHLLTLTPL